MLQGGRDAASPAACCRLPPDPGTELIPPQPGCSTLPPAGKPNNRGRKRASWGQQTGRGVPARPPPPLQQPSFCPVPHPGGGKVPAAQRSWPHTALPAPHRGLHHTAMEEAGCWCDPSPSMRGALGSLLQLHIPCTSAMSLDGCPCACPHASRCVLVCLCCAGGSPRAVPRPPAAHPPNSIVLPV